MLIIQNTQLSEMSEIVQKEIKKYNKHILEEYRLKNPSVFSKLFDICQNDNYILGIGFGRKVTGAEQECAKMCLENLHINLNF
jgi:dsRNA-specific ribonuclease